jgi:hypothetical protein
MAAVVLIIAWAITGPVFHYSDTWQLIINTSTTIVTFLMVFVGADQLVELRRPRWQEPLSAIRNTWRADRYGSRPMT